MVSLTERLSGSGLVYVTLKVSIKTCLDLVVLASSERGGPPLSEFEIDGGGCLHLKHLTDTFIQNKLEKHTFISLCVSWELNP